MKYDLKKIGKFNLHLFINFPKKGEYTIEPSKLRWYQLILFGIFVVFSFILFNLLLGMSIEDIQNLRDDALQRDLERKAKKFIETNDKFEEIYAERT